MAMLEANTRVREGRELFLDDGLVPSLAIATTAPAASNQVDMWTWSFVHDEWRGPQPGFTLVPIRALMVGLAIDVAEAITRLARMVDAARRARREYFADSVGGRPKRLLDIAVALIALMLSCPLMLVVAALIKLTTGGPVIFAHPRVGFKGKTFRCYKFRSMVVDADAMLARHLAANPIAAQEWCEDHKLKNDPRITPLGRLLRKSSLDELPQLFNVLRGEMSCVGPRPIVAGELARYGSRVGFYLRARPGMTGMWQVSGRSTCGYRERVMLDRAYARRWSIWLDLALLLRTIPAVLAFDHAA
jgi:exopolysaccharide production protein ExoY